jgi:hypothetical protein
MDFLTYKARIQGFASCFVMLSIVRAFKEEMFKPGAFQAVKDEVASTFRKMMAEAEFRNSQKIMPLPAEVLESIKNVNLFADMETLVQQAEAVKQEIISLGKFIGVQSRKFKVPYLSTGTLLFPESKGKIIDDLPMWEKITDYIRDPAGKIVSPFAFWEDCIEIYLLKHLHKLSNYKIARKQMTIKTSETAPGRQREKIVSEYLAETERLREAVRQNMFPPMTLSAGKQPSMIN